MLLLKIASANKDFFKRDLGTRNTRSATKKMLIFAQLNKHIKNMIKRLLLGVLACLTISTTFADEGMWLPSLIKERIKEMRKMGFKLKAEDIYSADKASLKEIGRASCRERV